MTVVVDCGCADWGESTSIERLISRFRPEHLYGFDPYPHYSERQYVFDGCTVATVRSAAWVSNGSIPWVNDTTRSHPASETEEHDAMVGCFDLAHFIDEFDEPVVLKLDVEGAEHVLIPHLIATGAIENVRLLLVEFHGQYEGPSIPVPWEVWA